MAKRLPFHTMLLGAMVCLATPAIADHHAEPQTETAEASEAEAAATAATAQAAQTAAAEPEEITDRNHPDYVRCRSERVIGSLAQRRRTCMTNRQWEEAGKQGNRVANELIDDMRANSTSGS